MTQTADSCVTPRHLRHPVTQVYVTGDALPGPCVTLKPQVRAPNDADDGGDAEIRTSDTAAYSRTPKRPGMETPA